MADLELAFRPQFFRFIAYLILIVTLAASAILTHLFTVPAGILDLSDNALINTFGYNNVCVLIDDLPAKYVAAFMWVLFIMSWNCYELLIWVRIRAEHRAAEVSDVWFKLFTGVGIFDVLGVTYSISIFAVHPKENFVMHTVPFSVLIAVVSCAAIREVIFGTDDVPGSGHGFRSLKIGWQKAGFYAYLVILLVNSLAKVAFQFSGIVRGNPPPVALGHGNDVCWMVLALVVPCVWGGATAWRDHSGAFLVKISLSAAAYSTPCHGDEIFIE